MIWLTFFVNNDYYKKRLIFVNVKNQKNSDIYENVLKELKDRAMARGEDVPFTSKQLRTKFKKAVADPYHKNINWYQMV